MKLLVSLKKFADFLKINNADIRKIVLHSTDACNLNCKYCSRGIPFKKSRKSYSASEFVPWLDFLITRGIRFETIAISGGEPFLHPNIFDFIDELKNRYPGKTIRLITNFSWANVESIREFAPNLKNLDNCVLSKYPQVSERCGGGERFDSLVALFRQSCPHVNVEVHELSHFVSWALHEYREPARGACATERADCNTLGPDGTITRCVIGCGARHINEYRSILEKNREYCFDLKQWDKKEFLRFIRRYPFDLCWHCTFTHHESVEWRPEDRIESGELTPAVR